MIKNRPRCDCALGRLLASFFVVVVATGAAAQGNKHDWYKDLLKPYDVKSPPQPQGVKPPAEVPAAPAAPPREVRRIVLTPLDDLSKGAVALELLKRQLKDPDSARLRDLFVNQDGLICGQVNAKNSYGGYIGFQHFVADTERGSALIVPDVQGVLSGSLRGRSAEQLKYDLDALTTFQRACIQQK